MVFLSSDLRPPRGPTDDRLVRLAVEIEAAGIQLGAGADLGMIAGLAAVSAHEGLAIGAAVLPLPERPLSRGRRLPRLGSPARDEREAAIALARQGLDAMTAVGARLALLDFGGLALKSPAAGVARAFARRELGEDEPGARLLAAAVDERRMHAAEVMDACRWSVEALVKNAERLRATLVLPVGPTPWDAPSPREARELVAAFEGAPVGLAWDPGRLSVLLALGLAISDDSLRELAASAVVTLDGDAVGIAAGYVSGLGERDPRVTSLAPPPETPIVVVGTADATDEEIVAAVRRASTRAATPAA